MVNIWQTFLFNPIFNLLVALYQTTDSLGISIIGFTLVARAILLPVSIPQIKMSKKQRDLQPEIVLGKALYPKFYEAGESMEDDRKGTIPDSSIQ